MLRAIAHSSALGKIFLRWTEMANCDQLDDFSDTEIEQIVKRYYLYLYELTNQPIHSFRAGGWCIQPFSRLYKVFKELNLKIDSSVFPGGKFQSPHYDFDFTAVHAYSPA